MPRPTRPRTSLPSHPRAAKFGAKAAADDGDSMMVDDHAGPSSEVIETESAFEEEPVRPPSKQKKADKLYARREALLAKITAGSTPYSKSHTRRTKRAARPSENLVTGLGEVKEVLQEVKELVAKKEVEEAKAVEEPLAGGKGKEKLTAKKRQRVLTDEAARMPAVLANSSFAAKPWETIRLHTLNTMETFKPPPKPKAAPKAKKGRS